MLIIGERELGNCVSCVRNFPDKHYILAKAKKKSRQKSAVPLSAMRWQQSLLFNYRMAPARI